MISCALKSSAYALSETLGFNAFSRFILRRRLLVLCYHSVVSDGAPNDPRFNVAVTRSQFESQLQQLALDWTPVEIRDILAACYENTTLPANAILITFDDGFRNNYTFAAPLLKKFGFPAVFFVTTSHIGSTRLLWTHDLVERVLAWPESHLPVPSPRGATRPLPPAAEDRNPLASSLVAQCKRLPNHRRLEYLQRLKVHELPSLSHWQHELYDFMSWNEVRKLASLGFHVGAHTVDHPILASLPEGELEYQLTQSKLTIESELACKCPALAYPNGASDDINHNTIHAARSCGYRLGFTLRETRNPLPLNPMAVDRLCMTGDTSLGLFRARLAGVR